MGVNVRAQIRVRSFFTSRWILVSLRAVGWGLLAAYLTFTRDLRVSAWALLVPIIPFPTFLLAKWLRLFDNYPKLNRYHLYSESDPSRPRPVSDDDWALQQMEYYNGMARGGKALFLTPWEDGLICVPVLLAGIGPLSVIMAGFAFAFLHLGGFTYLECIAKGITYVAVCYLVLPYGVLTVVVGHLLMNGIAFVGLQIGRRKLSEKLRPNPTIERDAREEAARAPHCER